MRGSVSWFVLLAGCAASPEPAPAPVAPEPAIVRIALTGLT